MYADTSVPHVCYTQTLINSTMIALWQDTQNKTLSQGQQGRIMRSLASTTKNVATPGEHYTQTTLSCQCTRPQAAAAPRPHPDHHSAHLHWLAGFPGWI